MRAEVKEMTDVLMGREEPPVDSGLLTLMEVAVAYFARAAEMTMILQRAETEGQIIKGSHPYKFRTGELRTFMELSKASIELGARRLTWERMLREQP